LSDTKIDGHAPPGNELGRVIAVRGSQASIGIVHPEWTEPGDRNATVGRVVGLTAPDKLVVGIVTETSIEAPAVARERGFTVVAVVDLIGEIRVREGQARFRRGITGYPTIGDLARVLSADQLALIHGDAAEEAISIGALQQDETLPASIDVDETLSKHFAVLGTTGVGKSSGVVVILREILECRPDLRIFLIDPHNEYAHSFGDRAQVLTPASLKLPFWLFSFEELVNVLYRNRPVIDEELEILAETIPIARRDYSEGGDRPVRRGDPRTAYTVDTPVPYRMSDVMALIDDRMGRLETRVARGAYLRLLSRIDSVVSDPRYAFMFENANVGGDTMAGLLQTLFRLPTHGKPMTIMQLAGFPTEVVDSVVSVLARMAFDFGLWSDGKLPLLFVCEEAHRYASVDRDVAFGPTRRAIARIAKEGRKYGVFLGLVTQRPAELDPSIMSQCSTLFAMRMANERDHALLRSAVSDAAASLLGFLPSLGTREVFAFGEGVAVPTRLVFKELAPENLPRSEAIADAGTDFGRTVNQDFIETVVDRWRRATLSSRNRTESPVQDQAAPAARPAEETVRQRLLKKTAGR
jgi:DNA helicase HerA-like ATPase